MPVTTTPDHVAIAVPSIDDAATRWRGQLGGAWTAPRMDDGPDFCTQQMRFANHAKLELLEPTTDDGFAARFLRRFGARVHHVTLQVPDLLVAVDQVRQAGYDVVDVSTSSDNWHEAFLRPSQVGGIIVQLARSGVSDAQWLEAMGSQAETVGDDAAELLGPTLFHPDLQACAQVWSVLGGAVTEVGSSIEVSWPGSPLTVRVEESEHLADPVLRFRGAHELPADPQIGPAVVLTA